MSTVGRFPSDLNVGVIRTHSSFVCHILLAWSHFPPGSASEDLMEGFPLRRVIT